VRIIVDKDGDLLRVIAVFIDNYLFYCKLYSYKDSIEDRNLTSREYVNVALRTLEKYYEAYRLDYIRKMESILQTLLEKDQIHIPLIVNTTDLEVVINKTSYPEKKITFTFYRKILGKYISRWLSTEIDIAANGIVTGFADSALYKVKTTNIKITREEALQTLQIANNIISKYAEENNRSIRAFKISLTWAPDHDQREGIYSKYTPYGILKHTFTHHIIRAL
jgi:hypothetical protein